jgi:hypothetical protein
MKDLKLQNAYKKTGQILHDIVQVKDFGDKTPKAQETKAEIYEQNYIKLKSCPEKESEEIPHIMGENIFKLYI